MQSMRTMGALNAVRMRSAIHQGEFDKAAHHIQTGLMLAKNVGETPMLITYLVGSAVATMTHARLEEWIAQPDAPSLFWPLTSLPQPLIDWRRGLEGETVMFDQLAPEVRRALQEAKPEPIPVEILQKRFRMLETTGQMRLNYVEAAFVLAQSEPRARAYFLKKGLTDAEIDRLPVTQLVLMYMLAEFDRINAEYRTVQSLPYWQARPYLVRFQKEREELRKQANLHRLPEFFLPAYEHVFRIRPRLERGFALLRVIEGLRLHSGQHGEWPETLEALGELPVPVDPFTGKAFHYRVQDGTAILEAFAAPGLGASDSSAVRYELTLRKKKSADGSH
jgi:hypothetical protein